MTVARLEPALPTDNRRARAHPRAMHFQWQVQAAVATLTLASHAELRNLFAQRRQATDVHAVVIAGSGGNFCSCGDVHAIIDPLVHLTAPKLLTFTRMTGTVVKTMRACHAFVTPSKPVFESN